MFWLMGHCCRWAKDAAKLDEERRERRAEKKAAAREELRELHRQLRQSRESEKA